MPHSGFGATLNPNPFQKISPAQVFFQTLQFFSTKGSFGIPLMNIYGSSHGPSAVVYRALRNFFKDFHSVCTFCKYLRWLVFKPVFVLKLWDQDGRVEYNGRKKLSKLFLFTWTSKIASKTLKLIGQMSFHSGVCDNL